MRLFLLFRLHVQRQCPNSRYNLGIGSFSLDASIFGASVRAVRRNVAPILLIQAIAGVLVVLYFQIEAVRHWAAMIAESKTRSGILGAVLAGAIAGGVMPEIAKLVTGKEKRIDRKLLERMGWAAFVYAVVGIQVDLLYKQQAIWFGEGTDAKTLAIKVFVDMTAFTLFVSFPTAASLFAWWRSGFKAKFWATAFTWRFYRDEIISKVPLGWAFWVPILTLTYALPTTLQFPYAMLAEAAWSVLFVHMMTEDSDKA